MVVRHLSGFLKDTLQFVASLDDGVAFGRTCYPVDAVDYRVGTIGLHCQFVAVAMKKIDQMSVYLKRRLTASQNYEVR